MAENEAVRGEEGLRLRRPEREQQVLRAESPEDLVEANDPVRTIWSVTGRLDLSAFYESVRSREGQAGRDATDPRLLVALWLYAATQGIGSARELARACEQQRAFQWLCGGVSVNYHTLSDFRVRHLGALDALLTQVITVLLERRLVEVWRISQDGTRVRAGAGAGSFRRRKRLEKLHETARRHVESLREQLEDPSVAAALSARQRAAQERAAREREERLDAALARLPELEKRQRKLARKVSKKDRPEKLRELRVSTTDADVRVMKMADGGFRPAVNVQVACDPASRSIVGVDVSSQGVDTGLSEPMRQQVEQRTGEKVREHLLDGGYLSFDEIERAQEEDVALVVPAKPPRNPERRATAYEPRPGDSEAVRAWRERMGTEEGQALYRLRGQTSETVNADLKTYRGLGPLTVRGLDKIKCVVLWSALAYNLLHFGAALIDRT